MFDLLPFYINIVIINFLDGESIMNFIRSHKGALKAFYKLYRYSEYTKNIFESTKFALHILLNFAVQNDLHYGHISGNTLRLALDSGSTYLNCRIYFHHNEVAYITCDKLIKYNYIGKCVNGKYTINEICESKGRPGVDRLLPVPKDLSSWTIICDNDLDYVHSIMKYNNAPKRVIKHSIDVKIKLLRYHFIPTMEFDNNDVLIKVFIDNHYEFIKFNTNYDGTIAPVNRNWDITGKCYRYKKGNTWYLTPFEYI